MPFVTSIERDGERLKEEWPWTWYGLNAFITAAFADTTRSELPKSDRQTREAYDEARNAANSHIAIDYSVTGIYYIRGCLLLTKGEQTLKRAYSFKGPDRDGNEFMYELREGDVLKAHRE